MTKSKLRKNAVERMTADLPKMVAWGRALEHDKRLLEEENTNLKVELTDCKVEADRLKAEVERLTFDPLTYLDDQGEWMPRHIHLAAVERLQTEVERLRKAGDALERVLTSRSGSYEAGNASHEWQSAKNYKPKA